MRPPRLRQRVWSRPMDRTSLMWTLVLFFGASVMFTTVRNITRDESTGFQVGAQAVAGLILIGVITVYVRRRP